MWVGGWADVGGLALVWMVLKVLTSSGPVWSSISTHGTFYANAVALILGLVQNTYTYQVLVAGSLPHLS